MEEQIRILATEILNEPTFLKPFINIDEWRNKPIKHRYIHGGFEGTNLRFSFYFPLEATYKGRFFHYLAPFQGHEDASQGCKGEEDRIAFAIAHGAYFVESNMGGPEASGETLLKNNSAVAEYSRFIASKLYGKHRPYGYVYGGSGGGFKTISCVENSDIWDGSVPFVIGSPVAIPNVFTVRAHAMRILRKKINKIVDAIEPGGRGINSIISELNEIEKEAFEEVSKMGFPIRAWIAHEYIGLGALPIFKPTIEQMDPQYFSDFWNTPGYLGSISNGSARKDRIQYKTKITDIFIPAIESNKQENKLSVDDAWQALKAIDLSKYKPWIKLESVPQGEDLYLIETDINILTGNAAGNKLPLYKIEGNIAYIGEGFGFPNMLEILSKLKPGDEVLIDNSNFIALQTYHRHQVPSLEYHIWDQFRDKDGNPIYPQRPFLVGPLITKGGAGSLQTGKFNGKMIVVASLLDESAFPWQADWYRQKVREFLGEHEKDNFRLWYIDNAMHGEVPKALESKIASYIGAVNQALLDVSDWVEKGIIPPDNTNYKVKAGQVYVPSNAEQRKGIQPVVNLLVNGKKCVEINNGEMVNFHAEIELPSNTGMITSVEWLFEQNNSFTDGQFSKTDDTGKKAIATISYIYTKPGTYFAAIRVKSNRIGDKDNIFTQIQNIDRVRVIVRNETVNNFV